LKNVIILGVTGALTTGVAIGIQAALSNRNGGLIGPIRTGLLTNFIGGVLAGVIVLYLVVSQGSSSWRLPTSAVVMLVTAGALGILIITGIAFSLQRAGVTAGLAAVILGQLLVSSIVDTTGWGGAEPIPLSLQRVAGLVVMAVAVYLLLPRE
jgi:transporter family-2 protein